MESCGKCTKRCQWVRYRKTAMIRRNAGHTTRSATADYVKSNYGFTGYGCGLCRIGVPCESKISVKSDV